MAEGKHRLPYLLELKAEIGPRRIEETPLQKAVAKLSPSKTLKREGRETADLIEEARRLRGKGKKSKKTRKVKRRRA